MFVNRSEFDFIPRFETAAAAVRDEVLALPEDLIEPWVEPHLYGTGWSLAGLSFMGRRIEPMCERCPQTAALLEGIDGLGMATFSRLARHSHIETHTGWGDRVYRFHLALVVPDDCAIRVGDETRAWKEGECLGFDDTVPHEAWNKSDEDRWVLMFDVRRPGLTGDVYEIEKLPTDLLARLQSWFPDMDPSKGKPRKTAESQ